MKPIEMYADPGAYPNLTVPAHVIERMVRHLGYLHAITLVRAAYRDENGGFATLAEAKEIYQLIMADRRHKLQGA